MKMDGCPRFFICQISKSSTGRLRQINNVQQEVREDLSCLKCHQSYRSSETASEFQDHRLSERDTSDSGNVACGYEVRQRQNHGHPITAFGCLRQNCEELNSSAIS